MRTYGHKKEQVFPILFLLLLDIITLPVRILLTAVAYKKHFRNLKESNKRRLAQQSSERSNQ